MAAKTYANFQDLMKHGERLENGCIVWSKSRTKAGYGQKALANTKFYVHRLVCAIFYGEPKSGMEVLHSCDNPPCFNPDHLSWGTRKQNVADMIAKGRNNIVPSRGEKHGMSKLTEEDVMEIRFLHRRGFVLTDLAKIYLTTASNISLIVTNKHWKGN